jgi:hypothetical protein
MSNLAGLEIICEHEMAQSRTKVVLYMPPPRLRLPSLWLATKCGSITSSFFVEAQTSLPIPHSYHHDRVTRLGV